ncbi:transferrin-binding protein-like solute binding protein [Muribacter muris]|uniref:transferrin-binding protein-like solute binding protein n=1 Tax=Muribacter muris TaxID=67855 RepID=UPI0018846E7E|nr:transferrin-binding protein-like solute binding protein [Muribacter muris]MBF0826344.1 transferrin-binding protein-like solute binding protein [Muribacter muris]
MKHSKTLKTALTILISLGVVACSSGSSQSENKTLNPKDSQSHKKEMKPSEPKTEMMPSQPEMKPSQPKTEMMPSQPEMKPFQPKTEMMPSQPEMKPSEPKTEMMPSQPEMKPSEPKTEMMPSQPEMKPSQPKTEMMPSHPEIKPSEPKKEVTLVDHRRFSDKDKFDFKELKKFVQFNDKGLFTINPKHSGTYLTEDKIDVVLIFDGSNEKIFELYSSQADNPFNYQRYGAYLGNYNARTPFSFGVVTDQKSIPTSGQYVYKGSAITYSHNDTALFTSKLDALADFDTKKLNISSYETKGYILDADPSPRSDWDFISNIKLEAGKSVFEGETQTTGKSPAHGKLKGAFYGPNAEEIGGTFELSRGLLNGAFGAKKAN